MAEQREDNQKCSGHKIYQFVTELDNKNNKQKQQFLFHHQLSLFFQPQDLLAQQKKKLFGLQNMNFFRRKSFQNSSSSKDHYFLPDENQKDSSSQNPSDQESQTSQPHETLIINNFAHNAKIKIDVVYEDRIKVDKKITTTPKNSINQSMTHQNSPNRKILYNKTAKSMMKVFEGDCSHPPTPIKTPKQNYHFHDKSTQKNETTMHRYSNREDQDNNLNTKQNYLNDERKYQRYFNTQVLFPYPSTLLKTPQTAAQRQEHSVNFVKERTPFPEHNIGNENNNFLFKKRLQIPQSLKQRSLFMEPKEKSFYKPPQLFLNDSVNQVKQKNENNLYNDKPFETITNIEVGKEQKNDSLSGERMFFVREQISGDYLKDKDQQMRKRERFVNQVKSSECLESEIAQQVQHENSFFDKNIKKGQIEELIMPSYHIEKPQNGKNQKANNHVWFEEPVMEEQKQNQSNQDIDEQRRSSLYTQKNQNSAVQVLANQSVNTDQQSNYLNESHPELNSLNTFSVEKPQYFSNSNQQDQPQPQSHLATSQYHITTDNINFQSQQKLNQTESQGESQFYVQKQERIKELPLASAGKWKKQRSSETLDVGQYSTRPKITQVTEFYIQSQSSIYKLGQKPNELILKSQIQDDKENEAETIHKKIENEPSSQSQQSQNSINELSQIQKKSPRQNIDQEQLKYHTANNSQKHLQNKFHSQYTVTQQIQSTNKKQLQQLKFESVISYTISPSPKNVKFCSSINQKFTKQPQIQNFPLRSSDKISLTSSIQNSLSRSRSRDSPKTYQELQKYKKLFKKQKNTKNPQIQSFNQSKRSAEKSTLTYSHLHNQKYSQRSMIIKRHEHIKLQQNNNDEYPVNDTPKSRQKIKNYFTEGHSFDQKARFSYPRNQQLDRQYSQQKLQRKEYATEKVVKVTLKDKRAEDLFTKHKDEFLNKLKRKEKSQKQSINQYLSNRSTSRSNQKQSCTKSTYANTTQNIGGMKNYQLTRKRPLSPYIQNVTNRLSSPTPKNYICEHYKKHYRRDLRAKFEQLLNKDDRIMLKKYYFSQEEMNQIFVEQILGQQLNEIYWVEILKEYGEKKLERMRLRANTRFHPHEKTIVRHEQLLADARRTYGHYGDRQYR